MKVDLVSFNDECAIANKISIKKDNIKECYEYLISYYRENKDIQIAYIDYLDEILIWTDNTKIVSRMGDTLILTKKGVFKYALGKEADKYWVTR